MNFDTQICTTREQSERLLAMGLKKETADMYITNMSIKGSFYTDNWQVGSISYKEVMSFWIEKGLNVENAAWEIIPTWSLHRLMELCPKSIHLDDYADTHYYLRTTLDKVLYQRDDKNWLKICDKGNIYSRMVDMIGWLIKNNHFNKEYLEG